MNLVRMETLYILLKYLSVGVLYISLCLITAVRPCRALLAIKST